MKAILAMSMAVALISPSLAAAAPKAADAAKPAQKKEKLICRDVQETGSRMGNIKMCKTAEAWNAEKTGNGQFNNGNVFLDERPLSAGRSASGGP